MQDYNNEKEKSQFFIANKIEFDAFYFMKKQIIGYKALKLMI